MNNLQNEKLPWPASGAEFGAKVVAKADQLYSLKLLARAVACLGLRLWLTNSLLLFGKLIFMLLVARTK